MCLERAFGLSDRRERTVKKPVMRPIRIEEPAGDEKFGNASPFVVPVVAPSSVEN
jgi:hypothetical protein